MALPVTFQARDDPNGKVNVVNEFHIPKSITLAEFHVNIM